MQISFLTWQNPKCGKKYFVLLAGRSVLETRLSSLQTALRRPEITYSPAVSQITTQTRGELNTPLITNHNNSSQ